MATNVSTNVKLGRVRIYQAPASTSDPVFAALPSGSWTYLGWMESATAMTATIGMLELTVDDLITPVDTVANARAVGVTGSLAEFTGTNLNFAMGGTLSSVAPASGVPGYDMNIIKGSDDINRRAIVVEQQDPREIAGQVGRVRVFFPYCTVAASGNVSMSRKATAAIPFTINGHPALDGSETMSVARIITGIAL